MTLPKHRLAGHELVDEDNHVVLRQIAVGPLDTNCYALHATRSRSAVLVDPGGDAPAILAAYADLDIILILLTHTHWDHVEALAEVHDATGAPIAAHPADQPVWPHERAHLSQHDHWDAGTATAHLLADGCPLRPPGDAPLWDGTVHRTVCDGDVARAGPLALTVLHTPGHTPGGISLHTPGHVLSGDTLFPGGPGLTGWPLSDFPTIIQSIEQKLMSLPPETMVHPGHGHPTTIGHEQPQLGHWRQRGW